MKQWLKAIQKQTYGMDRKQKWEYIQTYYWCHILGVCAGVALIIFLIYHLTYGMQKPEFHCVIVNQQTDYERDETVTDAFSEFTGIKPNTLLFDSGYCITYGTMATDQQTQSSYEKFFFGWSAQDLDAVVLPESFYQYCQEQDYTFLSIAQVSSEMPSQMLYIDGCAIVLDQTAFYRQAGLAGLNTANGEIEQLLLAFPSNSKHLETCKQFLKYVLQQEAT